MNVYYIGNSYQGCYYVRCLIPIVNNGWDGTRVSLFPTPKSDRQMAQEALRNDVIVFHRPDDPQKLELAKILRKQGKMIVYDNDDTYKPNSGVPTNMQDMYSGSLLVKMNDNLRRFAEFADLCTTTTEFLAAEFRKYNKNVEVLPNVIDPKDWDAPLKNETDKVRVGLVGSVLANDDYADVKDVLLKLPSNVQLVVFGLPVDSEKTKICRKVYKKEIDFWQSLPIEWQPFVPMYQYFETLNKLRLDVMLIPRNESYFNKCKSNLKFLEAGILGVPVIASGFSDGMSPYDKDLDGKNGILIKDKNDWAPAILSLVNDRKKRIEMGRVANEYVLEKYNVETNNNWEQIYANYYQK